MIVGRKGLVPSSTSAIPENRYPPYKSGSPIPTTPWIDMCQKSGTPPQKKKCGFPAAFSLNNFKPTPKQGTHIHMEQPHETPFSGPFWLLPAGSVQLWGPPARGPGAAGRCPARCAGPPLPAPSPPLRIRSEASDRPRGERRNVGNRLSTYL